jgi:hypothetical protein
MIPATRNALSSLPLARMAGHRRGYRVLNGGVPGMSSQEQEFRYRMHELSGEVQQLLRCGPEDESRLAGAGDLWRHVYGLHEFFGNSNRMDDMIGLLMMARKEWRGRELESAKLEALRECFDAISTQPHTASLMLELGEGLEREGVDMNSGF